jgi:hypothetical protein
VGDEGFGLGVVGDVQGVLGGDAEVDRVDYDAGLGAGQVDLDELYAVLQETGDLVALLQAQGHQAVGQAAGALV